MGLESDEDIKVIFNSLKPDAFIRIFLSLLLIFPLLYAILEYLDSFIFMSKSMFIGFICMISIVCMWISYVISYRKWAKLQNTLTNHIQSIDNSNVQ